MEAFSLISSIISLYYAFAFSFRDISNTSRITVTATYTLVPAFHYGHVTIADRRSAIIVFGQILKVGLLGTTILD